jgi:hypothetical protein
LKQLALSSATFKILRYKVIPKTGGGRTGSQELTLQIEVIRIQPVHPGEPIQLVQVPGQSIFRLNPSLPET